MPMSLTLPDEHPVRNGGFCDQCACWHLLPWDAAWQALQSLLALLEGEARLDLATPPERADPRLAIAPLFQPGGGKMLGVLLASDNAGKIHELRAFSGMAGGRWQIPGWVPPIFDEATFWARHRPAAEAIRRITRQMAALPALSPEYRQLQRERRRISTENTAALHALYHLHNFRGESAPLRDIFPKTHRTGPPTGTGDCCAPKLLIEAQRQHLRPLSLAECFFGQDRPHAARPKIHGKRYAPCAEKCQPILGFLLCGLAD